VPGCIGWAVWTIRGHHGVLQAIASVSPLPKPSHREDRIKLVARAMIATTGGFYPVPEA